MMIMENDYIKQAQNCMEKLSKDHKLPTTSQLRRFLTAVNAVSGKIDVHRDKNGGKIDALPTELATEVEFLQVKLAYQIGRDTKHVMKPFNDETGLMNRIKKIGNNAKAFDDFTRYVEALVAFHKFYGGKED